MFCPKCGQERASTEVRFCSRCGFHLGGVDALLVQEASLSAPHSMPLAALPVVAPVGPSPRQVGTRLGAKVMFISMVLTPLLIGLSIVVDSPAPLLIPFTIFLAGLCRTAYALLFEERHPMPQASMPALPRPGVYVPPALPPRHSAPLTATAGRAPNTGEVVTPPSVTEHTTRFLEDK
jgi:hypothetical protein